MKLNGEGLQGEASLWSRWRQNQDQVALAGLLRLHLPHAHAFAATYFARRAHDDVEVDEYVQFAALGLLEAMNRFDPSRGTDFMHFASRRIHGAILDGIERISASQDDRPVALSHAEETSETIHFYGLAESRQSRQQVLDGIASLPQQERTVIEGHYLHDQPFEDVALRLGLTRGRISQIHKRALLRLRVTLQQGDKKALDFHQAPAC